MVPSVLCRAREFAMSVSELMAARLGKKPKTTEELMQELNQFSRLDRIVGRMSALDSTKDSVSVFNSKDAEHSLAAAAQPARIDSSVKKTGCFYSSHQWHPCVLTIRLRAQKEKQRQRRNLVCGRENWNTDYTPDIMAEQSLRLYADSKKKKTSSSATSTAGWYCKHENRNCEDCWFVSARKKDLRSFNTRCFSVPIIQYKESMLWQTDEVVYIVSHTVDDGGVSKGERVLYARTKVSSGVSPGAFRFASQSWPWSLRCNDHW